GNPCGCPGSDKRNGLRVGSHKGWPYESSLLCAAARSAPRRRAPALVDLPADQRDCLLVDGRGIPGLDGGIVRLPRLVASAGAPAMGLEEVGGRVQGV